MKSVKGVFEILMRCLNIITLKEMDKQNSAPSFEEERKSKIWRMEKRWGGCELEEMQNKNRIKNENYSDERQMLGHKLII